MKSTSPISEIIPNLYLGCWGIAKDKELLKYLGITHIVNASGFINPYPEDFEYLSINIEDDEEEDIDVYFTKTSRFIYNAVFGKNSESPKGKVLIHCLAGISRSATLVIAFLMKKRKMDLQSAMNLVKTKRPIIDPNCGFLDQLISLDKQLKNKRCMESLMKNNKYITHIHVTITPYDTLSNAMSNTMYYHYYVSRGSM